MNHIEQAIKEAVEKGGYKGGEFKWATSHVQDTVVIEMAKRLVLLDPAFWQALGKARGWPEDKYCISFGADRSPEFASRYGGRAYMIGTWQWNQNRLIDHLAEGKDAESFFATL